MVNPYTYLPPYVLSALVFVGTYCLILAYQKQHEISMVLSKGQKYAGTVVEMRDHPSGNGSQAPTVEFDSQHGTGHRHYSNTYRMLSNYKTGQKVEVWYYSYKSIRLSALPDDEPGNLPKILFRWGIVLCLLSYPELIRRIATNFF